LPLHILAVDHAIPRAQGGPDEEWNYQLLCSYCNPVKGDRLTTQQLWAVNQESGVLTDIDRVRRLWKARARERRAIIGRHPFGTGRRLTEAGQCRLGGAVQE